MQTVIVNIILYHIYRVAYTILNLIIHMNFTSKNKLK